MRVKTRFGLDHGGDEDRIDVVLLGLGVDDVAERHRIDEELPADGYVDPPHLLVEDIVGLMLGSRKPGILEKMKSAAGEPVLWRSDGFVFGRGSGNESRQNRLRRPL